MSESAQPNIPGVIEQILTKRGLSRDEMGRFLYPDYDAHLHDPYLMTDMAAAVDRIVRAVDQKERVVIYGDYDIDGITASAIMIESLKSLGLDPISYIPDRFEEGYGINLEALQQLKHDGTNLVISVDCGITSVAEAAWARENGLHLVITDHHAVPDELPEAIAVVNPKRTGDAYPFKDLCGAGVAFKLVQALQQRLGRPEAGQEKWLLDLVALGTVCDVVTLVDENRVLVSYGLKVMRRTRRIGLRALANVGGVDIAKITSHDLGFVLGPRMNAAGRLEHAAQSLELLLTNEPERAAAIAADLDILNQQRRTTQAAIFKAADERAAAYADDPVLVLADADWSHGVVGIVASKLADKWQKPVLVAQMIGETIKGSARSTVTFNIVEALRAQSHLLVKFGGHFYAAGYTLASSDLDQLRIGLNQHYRKVVAGESAQIQPEVDASFTGLGEVGWDLVEVFELLEPFGAANSQPVVQVDGITVGQSRAIGREATHLKLTLRDGEQSLEAIGFGLAKAHYGLAPGQKLRARGYLNKNEYQGRSTVQLVVSDLQYE